MGDDFQNTRFTTGDESYAHELSRLSLKMEDHVIDNGMWVTYGSAVFMYDTVKIVPQTFGVKGALFMKHPITSDAFTTTFKMNLASMPSSNTKDVSGFALWYLQDAPRFPE